MILVSGLEETMAGTYTQIYIQVIFAVQGEARPAKQGLAGRSVQVHGGYHQK